MKTVFDILTIIVIFYWFPLCMMSPMSLAAHGAYEKENIIIGLILSYPILLSFIYWYFNVSLFSVSGATFFKWSAIIAGIPVFLILFNATQSLIKSKYIDVVLFPAIELKLTHNGKPSSAAKITQSINVREDNPVEHIHYANDEGVVSLPIISEKVRISPMAPLNYRQSIRVNYNHEDFFIWFFDTYNPDTKTAIKSLSISCELTDDLENVDITGASFRTSCKGDGIVVTQQKLFDE